MASTPVLTRWGSVALAWAGVGVLGVAAFVLGLGPSAEADPIGRMSPPETWEPLIERGIREMARDQARMQPGAMASRYQREAMRPAQGAEKVKRWYLLGRARALHYAALRAQAHKAGAASQRTALERDAERTLGDAFQAYRECTTLAPRCYYAFHDMGTLELQRPTPDLARAVQWLLEAARLHTRYPDPYRKLVRVYQEKKQWEAARTSLVHIVRIQPEDAIAREQLVGVYMELGQYEHARHEAQVLRGMVPDNPSVRILLAAIDLDAGRLAAAQRAFRALAEAFPAHPAPLQGYLKALEKRRTAGEPIKAEDVKWALDRLVLMERDPERRRALQEQIRLIESQMRQAAKPAEQQPRTIEELAEALPKGTEETRHRVLTWIRGSGERPPVPMLRAILGRLDHKQEPSARVRALAVDIAGRHMGFGWIAVLRLIPHQDPDDGVREEAVRALVRMAELHEGGRAAGVLVLDGLLDRLGEHAARGVAAATRLGILSLTRGRLDLKESATDAEHAKAFRAWWEGSEGAEHRIEALGDVHRLRDAHGEDLILPHLKDDSFFVRRAAWTALGRMQAWAASDKGRAWIRRQRGNADAVLSWWASLPAAPEGGLTRENEPGFVATRDAWVSRRPR